MQKTTRPVLGMIAAALLGACAAASSSDEQAKDPAVAFEQSTGTEWILDRHPLYKSVSFAFPRSGPVALPPGDAKDTVIALLDQHKALFGMTDPKSEWRFARESKEDDGSRNIRFSQWAANGTVFVDGAEWLVSVDPRGRLTTMIGTYVPGLATKNADGKISAQDAERAAANEVATRLGIDPATPQAKAGVARPLFHATGEAMPILAWEVDVVANDKDTISFVDADTGAVVQTFNGHSDGITTNPYGDSTGHGFPAAHYAPYTTGAPKIAFPIGTIHSDGKAFLSGSSATGVNIWTGRSGANVAIQGGPKDDFVADDAASFTGTPKGADVDSQHMFAEVADAYKRTFNRSSYDNAGGSLEVHLGENGSGAENAFFRKNRGVDWLIMLMSGNACSGTFGIGDGSARTLPMGASFDIIAHEFTHAVSNCTWGGTVSSESGAINEAMSDIMAMFLDGSTNGGNPTTEGRGIDLANPNSYFRNLGNPNDPLGGPGVCSQKSDWDSNACATYMDGTTRVTKETHYGSQIVSYAWYLMTFGGTHVKNGQRVQCPMGWQKSMELWSWVEFQRMPRSPDFRAVAQATLAAAQVKRQSLIPVACAWQAVGVITANEAKSTWNVDCAKGAAADGGAAPDGGGNTLLTPTAAAPLLCTDATSLIR